MKKQKTLKCKDCGKEYTYHNGWLERHVAKTGHIRYKTINDKPFLESQEMPKLQIKKPIQ